MEVAFYSYSSHFSHEQTLPNFHWVPLAKNSRFEAPVNFLANLSTNTPLFLLEKTF